MEVQRSDTEGTRSLTANTGSNSDGMALENEKVSSNAMTNLENKYLKIEQTTWKSDNSTEKNEKKVMVITH